jgi:hypothetical protein
MEVLLVENVTLLALNAHSSQLFAPTVTPIPTEFLDLMQLETKFATVFLASLKMLMEIVFNQTAMLIHFAQPAISFCLAQSVLDALLQPTESLPHLKNVSAESDSLI